MSFNFLNQNFNNGAVPNNTQPTTPAQFRLLQQGTASTNPYSSLAAHAARLQAAWALAQAARLTAATPPPGPRRRRRGLACHGRVTKAERRLRGLTGKARAVEESLMRYGNSDPKVLILKADMSFLQDILGACKPEQLQAMHELAVDLKKADEDIPVHVAGIFNTLMGKDVNTPLGESQS